MKQWDGYWYPDTETGLLGVPKAYADVEKYVLPKLKNTRTVLQAGGAVGVWPLRMSEVFDRVLTFEPNKVLFECLLKNCASATNIDAQNCALFEYSTEIRLKNVKPRNMGAWHVVPGGTTPAITVDSLNVRELDLLYLDIEGAELPALYGAEKTLERERPIVVLEMKQQCANNFGYSLDETREFLRSKDYRFSESFARDEMWVPQ